VPGITKKDRPLTKEHFAEFEKCYGADPSGLSRRKDLGEEGRFRRFKLADIKQRSYKLDITWLKDESLEDSSDLPEPQELATEATVVISMKYLINLQADAASQIVHAAAPINRQFLL
jgi:type I restriction enzyme M protein